MVAVVDYGVGNLFSLKCSFAAIGEEAEVTRDEKKLRAADRIVLPGVGAFADAMQKLRDTGMAAALLREAAAGKPILGICLGMQMLFEKSLEYGQWDGLGLLPGQVRPIAERIPAGYKIPHIGWNALRFPRPSALFRDVREGEYVYFVHSYSAVDCGGCVTAETEYGGILTAAAQRGGIFGCQFHPEKSGDTGLRILAAFCRAEV